MDAPASSSSIQIRFNPSKSKAQKKTEKEKSHRLLLRDLVFSSILPFHFIYVIFFLSRDEKEEKIVGSVERDETESGEKRGKRTKRTWRCYNWKLKLNLQTIESRRSWINISTYCVWCKSNYLDCEFQVPASYKLIKFQFSLNIQKIQLE